MYHHVAVAEVHHIFTYTIMWLWQGYIICTIMAGFPRGHARVVSVNRRYYQGFTPMLPWTGAQHYQHYCVSTPVKCICVPYPSMCFRQIVPYIVEPLY